MPWVGQSRISKDDQRLATRRSTIPNSKNTSQAWHPLREPPSHDTGLTPWPLQPPQLRPVANDRHKQYPTLVSRWSCHSGHHNTILITPITNTAELRPPPASQSYPLLYKARGSDLVWLKAVGCGQFVERLWTRVFPVPTAGCRMLAAAALPGPGAAHGSIESERHGHSQLMTAGRAPRTQATALHSPAER